MLKFIPTCFECDQSFDLITTPNDSEPGAEGKDHLLCSRCLLVQERAREPPTLQRLRADLDIGRNLVCVGPAGGGKSILLKKLTTQLCLRDPPVIFDVLCPTGRSALNVGGLTYHSLFGWRPGRNKKNGIGGFFGLSCSHLAKGSLSNGVVASKLEKALPCFKTGIKRIKSIGCLLFDEFSMIPYDALRSMDRICRVLKGRLDTPFGGIQVVFVGDPFQIAPPLGKYPFAGPAWDALNLAEHEVSTSHLYRFTTAEFSDMTRMIRLGLVSRAVEAKFMRRTQPPPERVMELYFTNKDVEAYNQERYAELDTPEHIYPSTLSLHLSLVPAGQVAALAADCPLNGKFTVAQLKGWPVPARLGEIVKQANRELSHVQKNLKELYGEDYMALKFKPGSRVICTVNHKEGGRLVYSNGSGGVIQTCGPESVTLALDDGPVIEVRPKALETMRRLRLPSASDEETEEVLVDVRLTFLHIPFRLGYAVTFNRAQGVTLDWVNVNGRKLTKKTGMLYVGLSRCRDLEHLYLDGVSLSKVKASGLAIIKFQDHIGRELKHLYAAHPEWFDDFQLQIDNDELIQKVFELIHAVKGGIASPRLLEPRSDTESSDEKKESDHATMPAFEAMTTKQLTKARGKSQRQLRDWLMKHQGRCLITGETIRQVLDVAHIKPYAEFTGDELKTAHVDNGMLLRKDLHALYDAGYLSLGDDGSILKSKSLLANPNYTHFEMVELLPFISRQHLCWHREHIWNRDL